MPVLFLFSYPFFACSLFGIFGFTFLAPLRRLFFLSRFPCRASPFTALFIRLFCRWLLIVPHLLKNAVRASRTTENTLKVNKHSQNRALFFITRKNEAATELPRFSFISCPHRLSVERRCRLKFRQRCQRA